MKDKEPICVYIDYYEDNQQLVAVFYQNQNAIATIDDNLESGMNRIEKFLATGILIPKNNDN